MRCALWHGPRSAKELSAEVGLPPDRLYYHLRQLERAGIAEVAEYRPLPNGKVERVYRRVEAGPPGDASSPEEVGLALAAAVVLALVAAGAARPDLPAAAWAEIIAACWLGSLPFAALGILLGLVTSSSSAQPAMIAAMLVLNVLGGLLVPLKAFPQWLRDVAYALPTYHLGALGWNAAAHRAFDPVDVLVLAGYGVVFTVLAAWRYQADQARPLG